MGNSLTNNGEIRSKNGKILTKNEEIHTINAKHVNQKMGKFCSKKTPFSHFWSEKSPVSINLSPFLESKPNFSNGNTHKKHWKPLSITTTHKKLNPPKWTIDNSNLKTMHNKSNETKIYDLVLQMFQNQNRWVSFAYSFD